MAAPRPSDRVARDAEPDDPLRDRYAALALPYIPRLLHLIDKNPYASTYGSFDRAFWHYRTMDFPCGMAQEFVLPLALVYARPYPGNRFHGVARVRELAEAAVRYLVPSSHADGTCDDYFPFERAMGALVFSLYAASEAYQVLGMDDPAVVDLFRKRVRHLAKEDESGRLSNHQALAALAAWNVHAITGDALAKRVAEQRIERTLSWQHPEEGWFQEYEGADPGYHTCTIDFLAKLRQKMRQQGARSDDPLRAPLLRAVDFAWHFIHPDGSYGGEYGSRNTYHFYPHGFELLAPESDRAGQIADAFLRAVPHDRRYHNDDDRMTAHYVYNFLQAWDDRTPTRPASLADDRRAPRVTWLPAAGMVTAWGDDRPYVAANLHKGGVLKVFDADGPIASDTGLIAELDDGTVVVSHLMQADVAAIEARVDAEANTAELRVRVPLCRRRRLQMTVIKQLLLRVWGLVIGRFNANLTRRIIQRLAITGKPRTRWTVERRIAIDPDGVTVEDRVPADLPAARLSIGSDATSIYVANSLTYQQSTLCPWQHADLDALPREDDQRVWRRRYARGSGHDPGGAMTVTAPTVDAADPTEHP
ncbi:MAG: hypothetical protein AAF772_07555 [Acidobacteriota bacterium]